MPFRFVTGGTQQVRRLQRPQSHTYIERTVRLPMLCSSHCSTARMQQCCGKWKQKRRGRCFQGSAREGKDGTLLVCVREPAVTAVPLGTAALFETARPRFVSDEAQVTAADQVGRSLSPGAERWDGNGGERTPVRCRRSAQALLHLVDHAYARPSFSPAARAWVSIDAGHAPALKRLGS